MKKRKNITQKNFNTIFSNKNDINYEFDVKNLSIRDKKIVKTLLGYGISGRKCLDVGPGTGRWLKFFRLNNASYIGAIDFSEIAVQNSRQYCDKIQLADVENESFNYDSNYFDVITSFMVLEHLKDPQNYISELVRVVKNNGIIIMSIPNIVSFMSRIRVLFGKLPVAIVLDKTHIKFYTKKELIKQFEPYNLVPKVIPTSFSINPFNTDLIKIPSLKIFSSFSDDLLFKINVNK